MENVEMAVSPKGSTEPRTIHLFASTQLAAKTGDDTYRSLCGRDIRADHCRIGHGEPICQNCVRIENACACVETVDHR